MGRKKLLESLCVNYLGRGQWVGIISLCLSFRFKEKIIRTGHRQNKMENNGFRCFGLPLWPESEGVSVITK